MHTHTYTHTLTCTHCEFLGSNSGLRSQAKQGKVFQVAGTAFAKGGSRSVFRETERSWCG